MSCYAQVAAVFAMTATMLWSCQHDGPRLCLSTIRECEVMFTVRIPFCLLIAPCCIVCNEAKGAIAHCYTYHDHKVDSQTSCSLGNTVQWKLHWVAFSWLLPFGSALLFRRCLTVMCCRY